MEKEKYLTLTRRVRLTSLTIACITGALYLIVQTPFDGTAHPTLANYAEKSFLWIAIVFIMSLMVYATTPRPGQE